MKEDIKHQGRSYIIEDKEVLCKLKRLYGVREKFFALLCEIDFAFS